MWDLALLDITTPIATKSAYPDADFVAIAALTNYDS